MEKFCFGLGKSPSSHHWGQGGDWASGALPPGGLRSEQQDAPNTHPSRAVRSDCLRSNQRSGVFFGIWGESGDGGT